MKAPTRRLAYLDWMRGLAAVTMLQGHVFHSFLRDDLRKSGPYVASQFVGGMPPAVFLFLLGVTFAFQMDSGERKGVPPTRRVLASLKRAGFIFAVAFAFRFQMWIVSFDKSPWTDLLRVDVLNTMGFALVWLSAMAAFRTVERIRLCAVLGVAIAALAPLVAAVNWGGTPVLLKQYLAPDSFYFGFFPWAAFVAFGMSVGSLLRHLDRTDRSQIGVAMQWLAGIGVALAFGAWVLSNSPIVIYPNSDFWINSPALILIKLGVLLMLLSFSWLWNLGQQEGQWNWIRQFGVTSLLVYWVHVELVYGRWLWFFKENLTVPQTVTAAICVTILMLGLSLVRTNWTTVKSWLRAAWSPVGSRGESEPGEASGD
jgi:peptidoglycan/LPS O-acetylase OafA/YrhL